MAADNAIGAGGPPGGGTAAGGGTATAAVPGGRGPRWWRALRWLLVAAPREWLFLVLALPAGLALLVVTPPYQAPDEHNHFLRACQVARGGLVAARQGDEVGGWVPAATWESILPAKTLFYNPAAKTSFARTADLFGLHHDAERAPVFADFRNTAVHAPTNYLPALPALAVGQALNLPPLVLFYLARLSFFAAWLALWWLALQQTPLLGWPALLLALLPLPLSLGAAVHTDAVIIPLAFLFVGLCLRLATQEAPATRATKALLLAAGALLAPAKFAYAPLLLLFFLIPRARLGGGRAYWRFAVLFWGMCGALLIAWGAVAASTHVTNTAGADAAAQVRFILAHPLEYAAVLGRTLDTEHLRLLLTAVGALNYLETMIPTWHFLGCLFVVLFACLLNDEAPVVGSRLRAVVAGVGVLAVGATLTLLYLHDVKVGAPTLGKLVQGRYFLPIAALLPPLLANRLFAVRRPAVLRGAYVAAAALSLVATVWVVYRRFYLA